MKKVFCVILSVLMLGGLVFPVSISSVAGTSSQGAEGKLHVHADGSFRILQIADLQDYFRPSTDTSSAVNVYFREMNTIALAIAREQPDLIVFSGDNIFGARGTLENGMTVFEYTVQKVTSLFGDIPFVVTFGNHDQESNSRDTGDNDRFTEAEQDAIYKKYGALTLTSDIVPGDTSGNATAKYGTGYVDIYDAAQETVIQRADCPKTKKRHGKISQNMV
ncbi:MAG: metallophosphoesterase [Clostridiales bacterium]|nr:metallophosphoesterase [Clostridiales bacterium]